MKHAAPRRRGGRHWILPGALLVASAVLVGLGVLSRSIVADFASWWPVWTVLVAGLLAGWRRRVGRIKVAGLISLAISLAFVTFVYGHLVGWSFLPSVVPDLEGPGVATLERAAVSATIEGGRLEVGIADPGPLYVLGVLRRGGSIGAPSAIEQQQGGDISVRLSPDADPGLYSYRGWSLRLDPTPIWTLNLGGDVDADLSALRLANLQLGGTGSIQLGAATGSTPVSVDGDFVVSIPEDEAVRVIGPAEVPTGWTRTDVGANSPVEGTGWVVSIAEGAIVEIVVR